MYSRRFDFKIRRKLGIISFVGKVTTNEEKKTRNIGIEREKKIKGVDYFLIYKIKSCQNSKIATKIN